MKYLLILLLLFSFSSVWALPDCEGSPLKTNFKSIPSSWHNCQGTFINTNKGYEGDKYVGEFRYGKMHGQGTNFFSSGNKYIGEYRESSMNGYGTFTWNFGDKYVGEFKDDKKHGKGTYTWSSGSTYVGEYKDDIKHGQGTETWADGAKYVGEYKDNIINGQGTFTWANTDKYVGEWEDFKRKGQGTYFFADGRVWDGQWKDTSFVSGKKYAAGEYNSSAVADNNNRQNEQIQEAIERERRKREQAEKELAKFKAEKKKEKERISSDIDPPQIIITSSSVQDKQGTIKGKVSDNIEVAELNIDGRKVSISSNGSFEHNLFIPQGGIEVIVEATDYAGLTNKEIITLERNEKEQTKAFSFAKLNPLNIKGKKNKNSVALIIGISKYNYAPEAKYADRDAIYFSDFAENILGIDKTNIKLISNNSANSVELKKALKIWLKGYSTPNQSDIFIFFAGHGLASADGKELYLLPYDGEPRLLEDTALLRSEIFDTVKSINPKSVTVFLDACYSGQTREKDMILADARPIAIVPIESDVPKNFTVFSASSGSQISGSLPEADHGLFSYFLMKGLEGDADANNDRKITNGELHSYVRSNVTRQAVRLGREQTPQLQGDENRVLVEFN